MRFCAVLVRRKIVGQLIWKKSGTQTNRDKMAILPCSKFPKEEKIILDEKSRKIPRKLKFHVDLSCMRSQEIESYFKRMQVAGKLYNL